MQPRMQRGFGEINGNVLHDPRSRSLVAGNWKMNGLRKSLAEAAAICAAVAAAGAGTAEVVICPPATLLMAAARICEGSPVALGGQHCHGEPFGPFTGDISAEMLKDAGATYVILGHSERRFGHHEGNASVREKAGAAFHAGLTAIICVGETQAEREAGDALRVVGSQLAGSIPSRHRWNASSSPTSRSGRSARVTRPNHKILPECTASSVTGWRNYCRGRAPACAFSMEVRSSLAMLPNCCGSRMSMARSSAARA